MPNGKTHDKINDILLVILIGVLAATGLSFQYGWLGIFSSMGFSAGYIWGTRYNGPDLDVKSKLYYRWGFLKFIWVPYHTMFAHRSKFTHGILLGDIIRYGYLTIVFGTTYLCLTLLLEKTGIAASFQSHSQSVLFVSIIKSFIHEHIRTIQFFLTAFFIGNVVASTVHIITDHTVSNAKRFMKRRKKNRTHPLKKNKHDKRK